MVAQIAVNMPTAVVQRDIVAEVPCADVSTINRATIERPPDLNERERERESHTQNM
jgi:hypothetical protein